MYLLLVSKNMDSEPTSGYLYFDISTHYHTEFRKIHIASARGTLHVNEHEQVCLRTESNFRDRKSVV